MNVACILLAAGGSTRLGSPKQRLKYQGKTLLRRAAESALAAGCRPVIAVLGSSASALQGELHGLDVQTVENANWQRGMGTSVRRGVEALAASLPMVDGVLLTLCDQPLVGPTQLRALLAAFGTAPSGAIAAAAYDDTVGVPVVLGRGDFDELRALPDAAGAKPVLARHRDRVVAVPMPEAATDIDTREQYERLAATTLVD